MKRFVLLFILLISQTVHAYEPAVVSASPIASQIGLDILRKGGSAADAAVATAFALTVAEPNYSGLGGGGFLLYYDAKKERLYFVDYREVAPQRAKSSFYRENPEKLEKGIHSVAVPGFILGMETIHKKWRRVSWPAILEPSIQLAKKGIPLRGRLRQKLIERKDYLKNDPEMLKIFVEPFEHGSGRIVQQELAATLENIMTGGAEVFYRGELAKKVASYFKDKKGSLTLNDLKNYRVHFRRPYKFKYDEYQLVSSPLPSSGGRGLDYLFRRTIINEVDRYDSFSPRAYELILKGMVDYFNYREFALGDTAGNILGHTTHLCVIDEEGNIAAMTNTINYSFGSGLIVPGTGIILNNEMADFSLRPKSANRIGAGRRPLSSMSPTIIFKDKKPKYVIGTSGGRTIPVNLFQIFYTAWRWDLTLSKAIRQPKFYYSPMSKKVIVEEKLGKKVRAVIEQRYEIDEKPSVGNVQGLIIQSETNTLPVSDPRGEGKGYDL